MSQARHKLASTRHYMDTAISLTINEVYIYPPGNYDTGTGGDGSGTNDDGISFDADANITRQVTSGASGETFYSDYKMTVGSSFTGIAGSQTWSKALINFDLMEQIPDMQSGSTIILDATLTLTYHSIGWYGQGGATSEARTGYVARVIPDVSSEEGLYDRCTWDESDVNSSTVWTTYGCEDEGTDYEMAENNPDGTTGSGFTMSDGTTMTLGDKVDIDITQLTQHSVDNDRILQLVLARDKNASDDFGAIPLTFDNITSYYTRNTTEFDVDPEDPELYWPKLTISYYNHY